MVVYDNRPLAMALYRGILRWTRSAREVPCNLRPKDVLAVCPAMDELQARFPQDFEAIPQLTRLAFRSSKLLKVCHSCAFQRESFVPFGEFGFKRAGKLEAVLWIILKSEL
jgi:hypothetical protein